MGVPWTVIGLAIVIVGLLTVLAASLFSRRRGLPASSPGTLGGVAGASVGPEDADSLIGRTLLVAQKNADDLERAAQKRADEIVANAEALANNILQSAHTEASQILQRTRDEANAIIGSTKQHTTGWLTLLKTETERMVLSAYTAFREAQRSVEQNVKSFPSELERYVADWAAGLPDERQEASALPANGAPAVDSHAGDLVRSSSR